MNPIQRIWESVGLLHFLYFKDLFIYLWLCWVFVPLWRLSLIVASGVTLPCGEWASHHGGCSCCRARALGTWASVAVVQGLCCSITCGIFLDQGLNLCPLHYKADSLPLDNLEAQWVPYFVQGSILLLAA